MNEPWEQLLKVIQASKVIKRPERLNRDQTFAEQGIDSLDQASVLLAIEEAYGVAMLKDPRRRPRSFRDVLELLSAAGKP
jgi:acyl carrier protein